MCTGKPTLLPAAAPLRPQADQAGPLPIRLHLRLQPAPHLPQGRPHRPLGPLREGGGRHVGRTAAPRHHCPAPQLQAGAGAGLARPGRTATALLLDLMHSCRGKMSSRSCLELVS